MSEPISPPPIHRYLPDWIPAYLSNGVIGLRVGRVPQREGSCVVNGLAALHPVDKVEGFAQAPYPIGGDLEIDGLQVSALPEHVRFIEQRYDFSCGELTTRFSFSVEELVVTIEVLVFCSRSQPSLVVQEVRLTANRECDVRLSAGVDPHGIAGHALARETRTPGTDEMVVDGSLLWECNGALSTCGAAYITRFEGVDGAERKRELDDDLAPLFTTYEFKATAGATAVLRQIAALVPRQVHEYPQRQATRLVAIGARTGFDALRSENRAAWRELWKGRVLLSGAGTRWQSLADAAFYYLHASAHPSSVFSTSMFGLAFWPNYHYYRGQVMWDIESFVFPALVLTDPHAADALLRYRTDRLNAARRNAAMNGYRGLQFPWAGGPLDGAEEIRVSAPLVPFEQHISLSVARAFAQYVHVTGDADFLDERAWPVLEGVAKWLESRAKRTDRGYEIRRVIGIAEQREEPIDNAAYMNMGAAVVLREASEAARRLGHQDADRWERIAREMFVPRKGDVILNHDRFTADEGGVAGATPEALAGLWPMGFHLDPAAERATLEFYLGRVEPYVGYPMLSPLLGTYAARLGDRARSAELFERGYADFINEPFWETDEFSRKFDDKPPVGPFQANIGGFLMSCLYGLPGIEASILPPEQWPTRKVVLPDGWDAIEVERLWVRGRETSLVARHGAERAELTRAALAQAPVEVTAE
jgi:trehalose/maltose hydrolase-like predicted phosphorylase